MTGFGATGLGLVVRVLGTCALAVLVALTGGPAAADSMRAAVRHAAQSFPQIAEASARVDGRAADLVARREDFLPRVSVFGDLGLDYFDDPPVGGRSTLVRREVGVNLALTLYDGERRAGQVRADAAELDAAIIRLADATEALTLRVVQVYLDVNRYRRLQALAQANVETHRRYVREITALVEGGGLPTAERFRVRDRLLRAQDQLADIAQARADAEVRFASLVGRPPQGRVPLPGRVPAPRSYEALRQAAVASSLSLLAAQKDVAVAAYDREVGQAGRAPTVTLNSGVSVGADLNGTRGAREDAYVGLQFEWTWTTGRTKAARDASLDAAIVAARAREAGVVREVERLAGTAWNAYAKHTRRLGLLHSQVAQNRAIVRQYRDEFDAAKRPLFDVLEAERALFAIRVQLVSAEALEAYARYRMLGARAKLGAHFGIAPIGSALSPRFEAAVAARPRDLDRLVIPALE
ncbi:MAG: TolC family protein [Shimia sp.]